MSNRFPRGPPARSPRWGLGVVAVIIALYPAGTVLLARVLLGERISTTQIAGLGIAALAVSLPALG